MCQYNNILLNFEHTYESTIITDGHKYKIEKANENHRIIMSCIFN